MLKVYSGVSDPAYAPVEEKASVRFNRLVKSWVFRVMAWRKRRAR
jgi:hypothetical protein